MEPKIKILYIDDEELNLTAFARLFRRVYDITTASSAKEGGEILEKESFHVILVDQRMPGTTGSEFFKEIAGVYPDSMRVLVTAYSDLNAVISAVNEGKIYRYISKPYKKEEMEDLIEEAYQVHRLKTLKDSDFTKYKQVFSSSQDAIFLVNEAGVVVDVNDTFLQILNTTKEEILEKEVREGVFTRVAGYDKLFPESISRIGFEDKEITILSSHGVPLDCLMSFNKVEQKEGEQNKISFKGTIKDISKYKSVLRDSMRNLMEHKEIKNEKLVSVLHENSAQNLSGINFLLSQLEGSIVSQDDKETLDLVQHTLKETIEELREVCFNILPKSLEYGISGAFEELASKIEAVYKTKCHIEIEDELPGVSKSFKVMIFRVIQSILKGLQKEETEIRIEINSNKDKIYSMVTGKIFDNNDAIIKQVSTEVDCYGGKITEQLVFDDYRCYSIVFPLPLVY